MAAEEGFESIARRTRSSKRSAVKAGRVAQGTKSAPAKPREAAPAPKKPRKAGGKGARHAMQQDSSSPSGAKGGMGGDGAEVPGDMETHLAAADLPIVISQALPPFLLMEAFKKPLKHMHPAAARVACTGSLREAAAEQPPTSPLMILVTQWPEPTADASEAFQQAEWFENGPLDQATFGSHIAFSACGLARWAVYGLWAPSLADTDKDASMGVGAQGPMRPSVWVRLGTGSLTSYSALGGKGVAKAGGFELDPALAPLAAAAGGGAEGEWTAIQSVCCGATPPPWTGAEIEAERAAALAASLTGQHCDPQWVVGIDGQPTWDILPKSGF